MELIGIDVGYAATRNTTGVARLAGGILVLGRATREWESRRDILGDGFAEMAAIDGPLLRKNADFKRKCESILARGTFSRRCKPGFSHIPGMGRRFQEAGRQTAEQLAVLTCGHDLIRSFPRAWPQKNMVEAFPNAFLGVLILDARFQARPKVPRRKKFDWLYETCLDEGSFQAVVNHIGREKLPGILEATATNRDHEKRAVLVCLLTAATVAAGKYTAVGDLRGGYIFLPPLSLWSPWARQELVRQFRRLAGVEVWIDGRRFESPGQLPYDASLTQPHEGTIA